MPISRQTWSIEKDRLTDKTNKIDILCLEMTPRTRRKLIDDASIVRTLKHSKSFGKFHNMIFIIKWHALANENKIIMRRCHFTCSGPYSHGVLNQGVLITLIYLDKSNIK